MEPISIKQQRKAIKRAAKAHVSAQLGACIGVRLLYLLPILLVQLIVYARPAYAMLRAAADGAELPPLAGLYTGSPLGVQILLLIATGPLQFGLMRFYIGVQRGAEPDVSTLFAPYAALQSCWTGIKMMFCRAFRAFLWTMGPALLCTTLLTAALLGGMARAMRFGSDELAAVDTVLLLVMAVAFVVVMAAISIRVMAYDAGWVLLDEDETRSVWDATREAAQAFRGQYGGLAAFVLSFAGWYILILAV
ncbi:MAG: hypothetical protein Q4D31_01410, partial [Eubacteriales bacterium]|nr:hypothetical protein [Eubacteriales bacterium]